METMTDVEQTVPSRLASRAEALRGKISDATENLSDQSQALIKDAQALVKRYPLQTIGIAVAGGALLGVAAYAIFGRRSSSISSGARNLQKLTDAGLGAWDSVREALVDGFEDIKEAAQNVKTSVGK